MKSESEIWQVLQAMMENQAYLVDLMSDPEEIKRWQYILQKEEVSGD